MYCAKCSRQTERNKNKISTKRSRLYICCRSPGGCVVGRDGGVVRARPPQNLRVIVPPGSLDAATRMSCRLIAKERLRRPPDLREGQALASRIVEVTPPTLKFRRYPQNVAVPFGVCYSVRRSASMQRLWAPV